MLVDLVVGENLKVQELGLPGVMLVSLNRFEDERGYFNELLSPSILSSLASPPLVQVNQSCSNAMVFRGMHMQRPPFGQSKLVHCSSGSITDFVLDVDPFSPSFGEKLIVQLSAETPQSLFIPQQYAHGFLALENATKVLYGVTRIRSIEHETSINVFSTPVGNELKGLNLTLSHPDRTAPDLDVHVANILRFERAKGSEV